MLSDLLEQISTVYYLSYVNYGGEDPNASHNAIVMG